MIALAQPNTESTDSPARTAGATSVWERVQIDQHLGAQYQVVRELGQHGPAEREVAEVVLEGCEAGNDPAVGAEGRNLVGDDLLRVGHLVFDECQHLPAETVASVVRQFPARGRRGRRVTDLGWGRSSLAESSGETEAAERQEGDHEYL